MCGARPLLYKLFLRDLLKSECAFDCLRGAHDLSLSLVVPRDLIQCNTCAKSISDHTVYYSIHSADSIYQLCHLLTFPVNQLCQ